MHVQQVKAVATKSETRLNPSKTVEVASIDVPDPGRPVRTLRAGEERRP